MNVDCWNAKTRTTTLAWCNCKTDQCEKWTKKRERFVPRERCGCCSAAVDWGVGGLTVRRSELFGACWRKCLTFLNDLYLKKNFCQLFVYNILKTFVFLTNALLFVFNRFRCSVRQCFPKCAPPVHSNVHGNNFTVYRIFDD